MSHTLPPLGYAYDALEPHFDTETMTIHHTKHHQTYVTTLNTALSDQPTLNTLDVNDLISKLSLTPVDKQKAIRNHGGGHANHSLFWRGLKTGTTPSGPLLKAIDETFGSVDSFMEKFETAAKTVFGSGWAWLIRPSSSPSTLKIATTANQDSPLMPAEIVGAENTGFPIIGLDVWEHAYYLKYRNVRPDYIKAFWQVCNWEEAGRRFEQSK